jgi:XTP/dITP diphosphohydrolase
MSRILLATRNAKKLGELRRIVGPEVTVLGLADVVAFPAEPETGATFEENAVAKALQAAAATGEVALADDSGFCVDALNGMPGVLSARWAGRHGDDPANNELLLAQLSDTPEDRRGAEFVCALALATPEADVSTRTARWRGRVLRTPRGANGFGYDPLFEPEDGNGLTSAELAPEEKDRRSHRGQALQLILPVLHQVLAARVPNS